jgi:hypothetical protein
MSWVTESPPYASQTAIPSGLGGVMEKGLAARTRGGSDACWFTSSILYCICHTRLFEPEHMYVCN